MQSKKCQVLVIGAGPGGYVAAIRAGQLGLSTVIVEGEKAGGTCLIRGCIPSKALIHAAHQFHNLAKHASKDGHMGISIPGPAELDMANLVGWKEGIVTRLNKGVEHLLKNAGAELIHGWAEFQDAKTVKVGKGKDAIIIQADNVILANGSVPIELPFMPFSENVISSRERLFHLKSYQNMLLLLVVDILVLNWASRSKCLDQKSPWLKRWTVYFQSSTRNFADRWK